MNQRSSTTRRHALKKALAFSTAQVATEDTTDAAAESSTDAGTESGTDGYDGTSGTDSGSGADTSAENTNNFVFDGETGDFSFTGDESAEYYTVWIYSVDEEGNQSDSYVAASSRLTGTGEITGNVDLSELAFGTYYTLS